MCLTRIQPLLRPESPIHRALFWVAISVLQLDEITLYGAGLALLEQNLHTLKSQGCFDKKETIAEVMMKTREKLEWHFKQLDHAVGLSFRSNFHFALVGHLIKVSRLCTTCGPSLQLPGISGLPSSHTYYGVAYVPRTHHVVGYYCQTAAPRQIRGDARQCGLSDSSCGCLRGGSLPLPCEACASALARRSQQQQHGQRRTAKRRANCKWRFYLNTYITE